MNKRFLIIFVIALLASVLGLKIFDNKKDYSYTTSYIEIISKTEKNGNYFITTVNPMTTKEQDEIIIQIANQNVWNLIEKGKSYFATYRTRPTETQYELLRIKYPAQTSNN